MFLIMINIKVMVLDEYRKIKSIQFIKYFQGFKVYVSLFLLQFYFYIEYFFDKSEIWIKSEVDEVLWFWCQYCEVQLVRLVYFMKELVYRYFIVLLLLVCFSVIRIFMKVVEVVGSKVFKDGRFWKYSIGFQVIVGGYRIYC